MKDKIFTATPINKSSAMVTGKGESDPYRQPTHTMDTDILPSHLLKDLTRDKGFSGFLDFTGQVADKITIIGKCSIVNSGNRGASWWGRCICKRYTRKRARIIRDALSGKRRLDGKPPLCCDRCNYLRKLKLKEKGII